MVLGSSPAPLSQRPLPDLSPNERDRTQDTPRDRIPISKVSSLQQHRQMGVLMRGCNMSCTTAAGGGGGIRRTRQRGRGIPVGSNRSAVRHTRFAMETVETSADRECPLSELVG